MNLYISRNYSQSRGEKTADYEEFRAKSRRIFGDQKAATSDPVFEKSLNDINNDQLMNFFRMQRVKEKFLGKNIESTEEKLNHLDLLFDKKYLIKGTFLCFGEKIQEICSSASPSMFFVSKTKERLKSKPFFSESVSGNLIEQYWKMQEHLKKNLYLVRDIYSDKEEDYEIPEIVFREALANAFAHRDYNSDVKSTIQVELYTDRLEIKNPGTFPPEIDMEKLGKIQMSYPMNKEIAGIFFLYKIVEKAGAGICRIQDELKKNGFKPMGISPDEKGNYVKVTMYKNKQVEIEDDDDVEKIIHLCGMHTLTVELLARTAQNAAMPLKTLIKTLENKGFNLNEVIGENVHTSWNNEKERKLFFDHLLTLFDLSGVTDAELHILINLAVLPAIDVSINDFSQWLGLESKGEINSLVKKGWLRRSGFTIFMHQVLQNVIRYKAGPDSKKCGKLITSLANRLSLEPGENPIDKKDYVIFGEVLVRHMDDNDEEFARLANNLSTIYKAQGQLEKALEFQEKAVAILQKFFPNGHYNLDIMKRNLEILKQEMEKN